MERMEKKEKKKLQLAVYIERASIKASTLTLAR